MTDVTILIVDDDHLIIQILSKALVDLGRVVFATSGEQALERVARLPVDLVLLDIMMPEMDGFATFTALRRIRPDIPVIFVTAASDPASEVQALAAGGNDFILVSSEIFSQESSATS